MFKKIILSVLLTLSAVVAADVKSEENASASIKWEKNFHTAMVKAQEQNKPVLFVYSRHTCKYCVVLEETTFQDKKVVEILNKEFISVVSYTDEDDYTPGELRRPGTPTMWFLYPSTLAMFQPIQGAIDAENFLNALSVVKTEFAKAESAKK